MAVERQERTMRSGRSSVGAILAPLFMLYQKWKRASVENHVDPPSTSQ